MIRVLFIFGLAAFVAGCGNVYPAADSRAGSPSIQLVEGEDEEEWTPILTPKPVPTPEPKSPTRDARVGVHAGYLMTGSGDEDEDDWDAAAVVGVYYRQPVRKSKRWAYEVGLDFSSLEREDGAVTSDLFLLRGGALFGGWHRSRGQTFYLMGGVDAAFENATNEVSGETDSALTAGLNLGAGFGSTRGVWDIRVLGSFFPGSENITNNFTVLMGLSF